MIAEMGDLDAVAITGKMWERGVRIYPTGPHRIRAVTHLGVGRDGIDRAIDAFRSAVC